MKDLSRKSILAALLVCAAVFVSQEAGAQKKSRKQAENLNGTIVYVDPLARTSPVEEKLKAKNKPAIEYAPTKTVYLYPKGQNIDQGIVEGKKAVTKGPLVSNGLTGPEKAEGWGFIANVTDSARIDIYLPEKPNGQMVIASPGGSYYNLSSWNEGSYLAKWMNDRGIACAVVKYRLPNGHWQVPLQDMQNAFRYCRFHAEEWGVRQIGVIGFSAGGHLASTVETMYVDEVTKPDFAVLIYPVISMTDGITHKNTKQNLLGKQEAWSDRDGFSFTQWYYRRIEKKDLEDMYDTSNDITPSTPPTFLALSTDDKVVPAANSISFYRALVENKVPVELHIYPRGGHGWGFSDLSSGLDPKLCKDALGSCRPEFSNALARWLQQQLESLDAKKEEPQPARVAFTRVPDETVYLYPEGQDSDKGIKGITLGPGESNGIDKPEEFVDRNLRNVGDSARFDLYFAKEPNGKMVIICPGGAYWFDAVVTEGAYVAEWLNSQGISAAVVKYRLPYGHWNVPLTDVQNVFRYCRYHAAEWGVKQIGVMGFSAGGHLAATASTLYCDAVTRPDFSVLVYPVISSEKGVAHEGSFNNLIGTSQYWTNRSAAVSGSESTFTAWSVNKDRYKGLKERYSLDKQVSTDTPKTFIIFSSNDGGVPPENEVRYYNALLECGVPCEMHAFPGGGHGYGFKSEKYEKDPIKDYRADFLASMARFLSEL